MGSSSVAKAVGVLVGSKLTIANKASSSMPVAWKIVIILFYLALIRALLDHILCPGVSSPPNPATRKFLKSWGRLS